MAKSYQIAGVYDTETTTLPEDLERGVGWRSFPYLYIVNDLREVDIYRYRADKSDDIRLYRSRRDMLAWLADLAEWSDRTGTVAVVCAYNLMFDLAPLMRDLASTYVLKVNAQSSTHVYTLDCYEVIDGEEFHRLRFWDTFFLEMGGLAAMGETCGLPKAKGDLDYTKTRHHLTPLTPAEEGYARRDVQVIPAYLRYLCESNDWLHPSMLGNAVLTKTSLVRQMAAHEIGKLRITTSKGNTMSLARSYELTCTREYAKNWHSYALRKACFRGGYTFTAAKWALREVRNVASLDVTSMHHTFIAGREVPHKFTAPPRLFLQRAVDKVLATSRSEVLARYWQPLDIALHVRVRLSNVRLRENSVFAEHGIGLLAQGKFSRRATECDWGTDAGKVAEESARAAGWLDRAGGAVFAYGKLISAEWAEVHCTELELWCVGRVYEWDSISAVTGEMSLKWMKTPDYLTLQTHMLYKRKQEVKPLANYYMEGTPYQGDIGDSVPPAIAEGVRAGTASKAFVEGYYNSTVKGMFNGIYGKEAMDLLKPSYRVAPDGTIQVDPATVATMETYRALAPEKCKVYYNCGSRIVGGSRMHLVIALELLHEKLGERFAPVGGDTDSIKAALAQSVTNEELMDALAPLHKAAREAIAEGSKRVRGLFPRHTSELAGVGCFDVESCGRTDRYERHIELWNKARVSLDASGGVHVTCAGLSRPARAYNIVKWIEDRMRRGVLFDRAVQEGIGYNAIVEPSVSHYLQRTSPKPWDMVREKVTDYLGEEMEVSEMQSPALYPECRTMGDTGKLSNAQNMEDLRMRGTFAVDRPRAVGWSAERGAYCDYLDEEETI